MKKHNQGTFGASGQIWEKHHELFIQLLELEEVVVDYTMPNTEPESGNVHISGRSPHYPIDGADYVIRYTFGKLEDDPIGVKIKLTDCIPINF